MRRLDTARSERLLHRIRRVFGNSQARYVTTKWADAVYEQEPNSGSKSCHVCGHPANFQAPTDSLRMPRFEVVDGGKYLQKGL